MRISDLILDCSPAIRGICGTIIEDISEAGLQTKIITAQPMGTQFRITRIHGASIGTVSHEIRSAVETMVEVVQPGSIRTDRVLVRGGHLPLVGPRVGNTCFIRRRIPSVSRVRNPIRRSSPQEFLPLHTPVYDLRFKAAW